MGNTSTISLALFFTSQLPFSCASLSPRIMFSITPNFASLVESGGLILIGENISVGACSPPLTKYYSCNTFRGQMFKQQSTFFLLFFFFLFTNNFLEGAFFPLHPPPSYRWTVFQTTPINWLVAVKGLMVTWFRFFGGAFEKCASTIENTRGWIESWVPKWMWYR